MATRVRPVSLNRSDGAPLLQSGCLISWLWITELCLSCRVINGVPSSGGLVSWADTWWRSCWIEATPFRCSTSVRATSCPVSPFTRETSATSRWDCDDHGDRLNTHPALTCNKRQNFVKLCYSAENCALTVSFLTVNDLQLQIIQPLMALVMHVSSCEVSDTFCSRLWCQPWKTCPWSSTVPRRPRPAMTVGCLRGSTFRAHAPLFKHASKLEYRWAVGKGSQRVRGGPPPPPHCI